MNPAADAGPALRDIHLPPAPGWWPPAPGWWVLALLAVALSAWLVVYLYRIWRRRRYRRAVMSEFDRCIGAVRNDPAALAAALSNFLRRLCKHEDAAKAALAGEPWLAHLDRGIDSDEFTRGVGRALIEAPFRRTAQYDSAALIALVRRWTRRALAAGVVHA
jgi:hypothetical protein